ncbi:DUF421 domain-containing protein [Paenibacillus humicola]|uniref:DUF421 domain-containing protein n=1 Tax=Paenibacillus humicola TaxID=3110540 RepID=UPI00237AD68B|nr:DUF421 domain-containing protein [Paenibacillus humicola]
METIWITTLRTLTGFFVLLILTRILGKKQLSQMTFFTYITGIALGNIAGDMVVHRDIKIIDGVAGLTLWALLTMTIEYVNLKSPKVRVLLDGEPTIVIKDGKIVKKAMASNKLNMDDLSMLLRDKDVFSVKQVDYAILEPNGKLSVLKKQEEETVTKKDLSVPMSRRLYLPTELIVDGKIVAKSLKELNIDRAWLEQQIKSGGASSVKDVFFAELQFDGSVFVDFKTDGQGLA